MTEIFSKIILKLVEIPLLKVVIAFALTFASFMLGDLYTTEVIAVVMLMVFDFVTGIAATVFEGNAIRSKRMAHSVVKCVVYFMAISAGKFLDASLPGEFAQYATIGFVATTEFISILENIGRMGFQTPKKLLNQLRENLTSKADR